jgi:uncharacterized coiled-coil protein SlyX
MSDSARFERLEIKVMQLENALAELSDVAVRQQRELTELRERLRYLTERLSSIDSPQGASASAHEPPPHY